MSRIILFEALQVGFEEGPVMSTVLLFFKKLDFFVGVIESVNFC